MLLCYSFQDWVARLMQKHQILIILKRILSAQCDVLIACYLVKNLSNFKQFLGIKIGNLLLYHLANRGKPLRKYEDFPSFKALYLQKVFEKLHLTQFLYFFEISLILVVGIELGLVPLFDHHAKFRHCSLNFGLFILIATTIHRILLFLKWTLYILVTSIFRYYASELFWLCQFQGFFVVRNH